MIFSSARNIGDCGFSLEGRSRADPSRSGLTKATVVVWYVVRQATKRAAIDRLTSHDLRRDCSRMSHVAVLRRKRDTDSETQRRIAKMFSIDSSTLLKAAKLLVLAACLAIASPLFAAFGLIDSGGYYIVDTGAGLVFKVQKLSGDITSLNYRGVEYQEPTKGSHINSGLGTSNVTATAYGSDYVKITVVDTTGTLTHYYIARNGFNQIYMATHFTQEPSIGLVRFIVRIPSQLLPNGPMPSDTRGNIGAIEASDIFRMPDGTSRSKHYSNHRLMDWAYTGATGNNVGVFMIRSNHEGDSGGPLYRSLINQAGGDQEIYEIINYGEAQTEPFRTNVLNGPYILAFTDGGPPPDTNIDTSWLGNLGLIGWVADVGRGNIGDTVSGIPSGFQAVVGLPTATPSIGQPRRMWTEVTLCGS